MSEVVQNDRRSDDAVAIRAETKRHLHAVPRALRRLLDRAGAPSLRAAEARIRERTGVRISFSTLSLWMRGEASPTLGHLIPFLHGLGLDLHDFTTAMDDAVRASDRELEEALRQGLADRPELRRELLAMARERGAAIDIGEEAVVSAASAALDVPVASR